jgi:hypothetical protein
LKEITRSGLTVRLFRTIRSRLTERLQKGFWILFSVILAKSKKKSIAIVGFSSKLLVGLATNRDALLKIEPSIAF